LKTIIQLLIAGVIVHACVQGAVAAWEHYQFQDDVEQEARFGDKRTTSELHRRVLEMGEEHGIPLAYEDVEVTRRGLQTSVEFTYARMVPLVPRLYEPSWTYTVSLSVHPVRPIAVDKPRR
jgi:hypothetical protein